MPRFPLIPRLLLFFRCHHLRLHARLLRWWANVLESTADALTGLAHLFRYPPHPIGDHTMQTTAELAPQQTDYIAEFRTALESGIREISRACKLYVEAIDSDPSWQDLFAEAFAEQIPPGSWARLEAVGRNRLHERFLIDANIPHATKVRKLPYSIQERIFAGHRFPLLLKGGEHILVDVREATPGQAAQILAPDHIRTLSEQRAYIEGQPVPTDEPVEQLPYIIRSGKVVFRRNTEMTKDQIRRLLQEI